MPFLISRTLPERNIAVTYAMMLSVQFDFRNDRIQAVIGQWVSQADYLSGAAPLYQEMIATNMGNLPAQTIEAAEAVLAQRGDWMAGATVIPAAPWLGGMDAPKEIARAQIDALASACRLRFISTGVGQDATYVSKERECRAYREAGYPDDLTGYPYIAAESAATGLSPRQTADDLIATADTWNLVLGPQIEGVRRGKKVEVDGCTNQAEIDAVVASARAAFNAVGA